MWFFPWPRRVAPRPRGSAQASSRTPLLCSSHTCLDVRSLTCRGKTPPRQFRELPLHRWGPGLSFPTAGLPPSSDRQ